MKAQVKKDKTTHNHSLLRAIRSVIEVELPKEKLEAIACAVQSEVAQFPNVSAKLAWNEKLHLRVEARDISDLRTAIASFLAMVRVAENTLTTVKQTER